MKKIIFVLLMVVLGSMVFAMTSPIHPLGVFDSEAVLTEYGVQQDIVTQSTVLVSAEFIMNEPTSIQAVVLSDKLITAQQTNIRDERFTKYSYLNSYW